MAKEKLFRPEDFDKNPDTSPKNKTRWIVGLVVLALIIISVVVFFEMRSCNSDSSKSSTTLPQANGITVVLDSSSETTVGQETIEIPLTEAPMDATKDKVTTVSPEKQQVQSLSDLPSTSPPVSSDIEKEALKVIHGDYGNNPNRKNTLGDSYQSIQAKVNEMKRKGVF